MAVRSEKPVISFILALVLLLNISVPVIYAFEMAEENAEPVQYCSFFCNLSPDMAKNSEKFSCPHHLKEMKKKRLSEHFQCRFVPASCHDNSPLANASSSGDTYLLSKHPINQVITASFLDFNYSTISSQTVISFLERPPRSLSSYLR